MGEAWFMGETRHLFHELMGDLSQLSAKVLQKPFEEIASGTSCFEPHEEWNVWYHYLLAQLLPRSHEEFVSPLLESFISGLFALYPTGMHTPPYPEFQSDVLNTLGRVIMDPRCWEGDEIIVGTILHRSDNNPARVWCWWDASGDLSASLYLCLKYLPSTLVRGWFTSVLMIPSPHWRAQVLAWLVGSHEMLVGQQHWPSEWPIEAHPSVRWESSHCLTPDLASSDGSIVSVSKSFLPRPAREVVLDVVRQYFTDDVFLAWLESISCVPYLERELAEIPFTFEDMYIHQRET